MSFKKTIIGLVAIIASLFNLNFANAMNNVDDVNEKTPLILHQGNYDFNVFNKNFECQNSEYMSHYSHSSHSSHSSHASHYSHYSYAR